MDYAKISKYELYIKAIYIAIKSISGLKFIHYGSQWGVLYYWGKRVFFFITLLYPIKG